MKVLINGLTSLNKSYSTKKEMYSNLPLDFVRHFWRAVFRASFLVRHFWRAIFRSLILGVPILAAVFCASFFWWCVSRTVFRAPFFARHFCLWSVMCKKKTIQSFIFKNPKMKRITLSQNRKNNFPGALCQTKSPKPWLASDLYWKLAVLGGGEVAVSVFIDFFKSLLQGKGKFDEMSRFAPCAPTLWYKPKL